MANSCFRLGRELAVTSTKASPQMNHALLHLLKGTIVSYHSTVTALGQLDWRLSLNA
jgi:hypothetical protein